MTVRNEMQQSMRRRAGFTLVEILAVAVVMSILLGIGVGVFSKLNIAKFSAVGIVRNTLRGARESAISNGVPVTVVCDAEENKLYDLSVRPFGHWQFEDAPDGGKNDAVSHGAFDLDARMAGARVADGGRVGGALYFNKAGDHALADLGGNASYAFSNGLSVECDLYFSSAVNGVLLKRNKQFRLGVAGDGSVEAEVFVAEGLEPDARPAGSVAATTPPGAVIPGQWSRIGFIYDRLTLMVYVDGLPLVTKIAKGREPVARSESPLEFGDKTGKVVARIDGVKLGFVSPGDGVKLPKDVKFGFTGASLSVHFLPDGRLDPAWHASPVVVPLQFPEDVKKQLTIGVYGNAR